MGGGYSDAHAILAEETAMPVRFRTASAGPRAVQRVPATCQRLPAELCCRGSEKRTHHVYHAAWTDAAVCICAW